jgi:hypothetical protein
MRISQCRLGQILVGHRPDLNANQFDPTPLRREERFSKILSNSLKVVTGQAICGRGTLMNKKI